MISSGVIIALGVFAFIMGLSFVMNFIRSMDGDGEVKISILDDPDKNLLYAKYIDAYQWAAKKFTVDTNAVNEWKALSEDKMEERLEYTLAYFVSRYSHQRPKNFPKMNSVVSNGNSYKCHGAKEFMAEFIEIVDGMKKDEDLVSLCDEYHVPVSFGVFGKDRRQKRVYSSFRDSGSSDNGDWL